MNATASSDSPAVTQHGESVKETIDSIVIAFILAFVFRAFIIEAFVIPTGSMAATLNGAHGTTVCSNCGWEFTYGLTDPANAPRSIVSVSDNFVAICPNCRHGNPTNEINDVRRNQEAGDRILVLKWPFDIGGPTLGPERWNVIVFKDPSDGTTNYIKRLAGLPEEVLEIIDGDVYTAPIDKLSAESLATLQAARHVKYLRRVLSDVQSRRLSPEDLPPGLADQLDIREIRRLEIELNEPMVALTRELDQKLEIERKGGMAQESLWQIVYDHDYPPREVGTDQPVWKPLRSDSAWNVKPRTLEFDGPDAPEQALQLLANYDNFCAYNTLPGSPVMPQRQLGFEPVSDLRVRFVIDYRGGDGAISATLIKRNDIFEGEIRPDGTVVIRRSSVSSPDVVETIDTARVAPLQPGRQTEFSFENLDHRVSLSIAGQEVLATTPDQYAPDIADLRTHPASPTAPVLISAREIQATLSHVIVNRDVFYISDVPRGSRPLDMAAWGTTGNPVLLRDGEYFMLGDNSAQSKDSRLWDEVGPHLQTRWEDYQLGTVPEDQLIGRAFFVYWPSGLRTRIFPPLQNVGWIPNFGRMRWIR